MKSFITSYDGLFSHRSSAAPAVARIEIPLIQRDYAQGREGATVQRIRDSFVDVLHRAVTLGEHTSLDFVYGDVESSTLRPLDGQQRLTTLFLLHWYLAFRASRLDEERGWKQFTYTTRPSARLFCQRLVQCRPPSAVQVLAAWIEDQPWHLFTWRHDPTIQSMLVMLDAMHQKFRADDCERAWERLVDPRSPAISFHLLPIEQMGLSEDLYIKMNSRGRPLTPFENFKARFEKTLEASCPEHVEEFGLKIDGPWADLLWPYHGGDFKIDDECLHYLDFIIEVCEWREGRLAHGELDQRAEHIFGPDNSRAAEHLNFLFHSFDTWVNADIKEVFGSLFALAPPSVDSGETQKVVLFGQQAGLGVDLFSACCRHYGEMRGKNRVFSLPHAVLMYAVLLHRLHSTPDFARRLRVLRNLVEASVNELRLESMPLLMADVERIVTTGSLTDLRAFNQAHIAEEQVKAELLAGNPALERAMFQLEDHPVLRGSLAAFDLDPETFERRAAAFHRLFVDAKCWPELAAALLATGDYSRRVHARFHFGSGANEAPWRELLTGAARPHLQRTREVLGHLLDCVAEYPGEVHECLEMIRSGWLQATESAREFDWTYYLVKYSAMREGKSGIYVGSNGTLGYSLCMLDKRMMYSWYRDPYLLAIWRASGVEDKVEDPWFTGYESEPRWMRLTTSGTALRCVENGIAIRPPASEEHAEAFAKVCEGHAVIGGQILTVPQILREARQVDTIDRVQLAAAFLRDLVNAGL